jgi:hypothetical protein
MVEEHRVGAGPAAPDPAQERGAEEQREAHAGDGKEHDPQVLRHEGQAEEVEHPVFDIEEHRRVAIDGNPGQRDIDCNQDHADPAAQSDPASAHVGRVQEVARSIGIDGRDGIQIGAFGAGHAAWASRIAFADPCGFAFPAGSPAMLVAGYAERKGKAERRHKTTRRKTQDRRGRNVAPSPLPHVLRPRGCKIDEVLIFDC